MTDHLEARVRKFVAEFCSVRPERIDRQTTLLGNLGVDGDDAVELFMAFEKEFQVDLSGLDLSKHFGSEGMSLLAPIYLLLLPIHLIICAIRRGKPLLRGGLVPIRVADLIAATERGKWVCEDGHNESVDDIEA